MKDKLSRLYDHDQERFRLSYATDDLGSLTQTQITAKLVFSTHSLEKSLSNDNFTIGHGFHAAYLLAGMVNTYLQKGYDTNHLAYINTLSTLKIFYDLHKGTPYQEKVETILGDNIIPIIESCESQIGGATSISIAQKKDNSKKNFKELSEGRYAVRAYADTPVKKSDIEEVVRIATKTPTVCNRQAIRVYTMYEQDVIESVLKIQGGIVHYDTPPRAASRDGRRQLLCWGERTKPGIYRWRVVCNVAALCTRIQRASGLPAACNVGRGGRACN